MPSATATPMEIEVEAVVFDLDGTLHQREPSIIRFARQMYDDYSIDLSVDAWVAHYLKVDDRGYGGPTAGLFDRLVREFELPVDPDTLTNRYRTTAWDEPALYADATATVGEIRSFGLKTAILTNGSQHSQNAKIENSGLTRHFDAIVISDVIGVKKPDPGAFDHVCRLLNVEPAATVMVGDSATHDIVGGKKAGLSTVWVRRVGWPEDIEPIYDLAVDQLDEIIPWLRAHRAT